MLPGEGVDTDYPVMRLAIDIVLGWSWCCWGEKFEVRNFTIFDLPGILCGLAGGTWVARLPY